MFQRLKKTIATISTFALVLGNVITPYSVAYAQEASTSAEISPTTAPTEIPSPTQVPEVSPTPSDIPEATPTVENTPTPTPEVTTTPRPTKTISGIPKEIVTPTQVATDSSTLTPAVKPKSVIDIKKPKKDKETDYIEGEILVQFKKNNVNLKTKDGKDKVKEFAEKHKLEKKDDVEDGNISLLKVKDNKPVKEVIKTLKEDKDVAIAQPNYKYKISDLGTNDTSKAQLWGLDNTGQNVNGTLGTSDADIDAPDAWTMSQGSGMIVAVIDTGVNYNHPDLTTNMWDGSACKDENNANLGGCISGYDYEDGDKNPLPTYHWHGTHVAGTIAAIRNNARGVAGTAPAAKIMALKSGLTTLENVKSIKFARYNGAKIINASWGGYGYDTLLKAEIDAFPGLFVAAAANDGLNNDASPAYPCSYDSANIICVAATDQNDNLATFSNYGISAVDVGAPGVNIYSTNVNVSTTDVVSHNYENVADGSIPAGYTQNGNWGVVNIGGAWGKVLYSDINNQYVASANTLYSSPTTSLAGGTAATITFWTACDTEYAAGWHDYMALEISSDGTTYNELLRWDEDYIDSDTSSDGYSVYLISELKIPNSYLTSNFKYRFRWVADGDGNIGGGGGCLVDDVVLTRYSASTAEAYSFSNGTSMAAPHVAGVAALVWAYNTNLSTVQAKNIVMYMGDSKASLAGKTVTGKRVNAFSSLKYIPNKTLDTTYYYPWYDDSNPNGHVQESWILVANPSAYQTATVEIYFKGVLRYSGSVLPNQSITPQFDEEVGGPVRVVSTNGVEIYSSSRNRYDDSFNETLGYPASQLTDTYYFPWYDDSDDIYTREAWVIMANPSTSQNVTVDLYYKGTLRYTDTLAPGEVLRRQFDEEVGGPVRVQARSGRSIYVSERVIFQNSVNEIMGYPNNQLDTTYYFPWYDDHDDPGFIREAWVLVANPSASQTANVEIYYKGVLRYTGTVAPGQSITPQFDEEVGGPVRVVSTNGVQIYTTERVRMNNSFNETFGMANSQITSTYYYPWYDDSNDAYVREAWVLVANPSASQTANVEIFYKGVKRWEGTIAPGQSVTPQFDEEVGGPVKVVSTNGVSVYTTERVRFQGSFNEIFGR